VARAFWNLSCFLGAGLLLASPAFAVDVRVTISNPSPVDGFAVSRFFLAAHDGSYDFFDDSSAANLGTENVAELGATADLISDINTAQPTAVAVQATATGGGVFLPGGSGSTLLLSLDPTLNRYLSYGAMVVPSNDAFVGNDSPTAFQLFDGGGNFVATTLTLTGSDIWDAGTEMNNSFGAAFLDGQDATMGDDENGMVHKDLATQFTAYAGLTTALGESFSYIPEADTTVATLTFEVIPEPATTVLAGLAFFAVVGFLRRRR
jgi:hypothetical protein